MDFDTPAPKDITPTAPEPVQTKPVPMPEKVKAAAKAVAEKRKPVTIDNESISGDPNEGNLDDVAAFKQMPSQEQLDKLLSAFSQHLNMTQPMIETECNFGPLNEWTIEQFEEARQVFKSLKTERDAMRGEQV